jgi:hypothetical protein
VRTSICSHFSHFQSSIINPFGAWDRVMESSAALATVAAHVSWPFAAQLLFECGHSCAQFVNFRGYLSSPLLATSLAPGSAASTIECEGPVLAAPSRPLLAANPHSLWATESSRDPRRRRTIGRARSAVPCRTRRHRDSACRRPGQDQAPSPVDRDVPVDGAASCAGSRATRTASAGATTAFADRLGRQRGGNHEGGRNRGDDRKLVEHVLLPD